MTAIKLDEHELACRIAEACIGLKRPAGKSARESLQEIEPHFPDAVSGFLKAARSAIIYVYECVRESDPDSRLISVQESGTRQ